MLGYTSESLEIGDLPILEASMSARDQLRETQAELSHANAQVAKIIEMSGPLELVGDRLERVVSRLRRDSSS